LASGKAALAPAAADLSHPYPLTGLDFGLFGLCLKPGARNNL